MKKEIYEVAKAEQLIYLLHLYGTPYELKYEDAQDFPWQKDGRIRKWTITFDPSKVVDHLLKS